MVRIQRITDPDATLAMIPWFVPDEQPRIAIGCSLSEKMLNDPDDTLVLIATEDNNVRALSVSFVETNPDTGERHVFIWQARTLPGFTQGKILMDSIGRWAIDKGIMRITTGMFLPQRRINAFCRRYGFKRLKDHYLTKEI
jgi:hypothetical protein